MEKPCSLTEKERGLKSPIRKVQSYHWVAVDVRRPVPASGEQATHFEQGNRKGDSRARTTQPIEDSRA